MQQPDTEALDALNPSFDLSYGCHDHTSCPASAARNN
jgi:hypothetical protein